MSRPQSNVTKLFLSFLLLSSVDARALDLKGVTVGAKVLPYDVSQALGIDCFEHSCAGKTTVVGLDAGVTVAYSGDWIVDTITVNFLADDYDRIEKACVAKFGKPKTSQTHVLNNAMGGRFRKFDLMWETADGSLALLTNVGDNLRPSLLIESREAFAAFQAKRAKSAHDL